MIGSPGFPYPCRSATIPARPYSSSGLYCVDTDGGGCHGSSQRLLCSGRSPKYRTSIPVRDRHQATTLVRVYRADSLLAGLLESPKDEPQRSVAGFGLGDRSSASGGNDLQRFPLLGEVLLLSDLVHSPQR